MVIPICVARITWRCALLAVQARENQARALRG
jgi:hypothetical protein